jgi:hypothetical protein
MADFGLAKEPLLRQFLQLERSPARVLPIPLDGMTSFKALVHPDVAEKILDSYWRKDGEVPKGYTINLASRFVALAHWTGGMDEEALRRL